MSWHYNYYKDGSIINQLVELIDENRVMRITTIDGNIFTATKDSDVNVGEEAMMIAEDNKVSFINTTHIIYIQLIGAKGEHYNLDND